MTIATEWLQTQTSEGPMAVYLARPSAENGYPGLVIVQEVFGVTDHIQDVTRRFAEEGFVAAAPALYHRFETQVISYDDVPAGLALRRRLNDEQVVEDVNAGVALLKGRTDVRPGAIGLVGYCVGGRFAYTTASRNPEVRACVSYYGMIATDDPSSPLNASEGLRAPVLLFYGGEDHSIPADKIERVRETLARLGKPHEIITYPRAGHGFFCDARPNEYNPEAAADSWPRTLQFLRQHLGQ